MEKETLKIKPLLSKESRSVNPSFFIFDLPTLVENMKHSHSWAKGELIAMILLKSPEKNIVLTALHKGTEIISFQSNDSVSFEIIEGKLKFRTRKQTVNLDKGQLLTFYENIKYCLTTREETVFLLTIANSTLKHADI